MNTKRNYHMFLTHVGDGRCRCGYCGEIDFFDNLRLGECQYVYEACGYCGGSDESNECKADCPGILEILSRSDVYVAGIDGLPDTTKAALARRGRA